MSKPAVTGAILSSSTVKTILVHIQNDESLEHRVETALSLARASSAHLYCLHVIPSQAYVVSDRIGGIFVMADIMNALEADEARIRQGVEAKLREEDVSWEYHQLAGDVTSVIISSAALADLVVVGREPHNSGFSGSNTSLFGDLLHRSRTPFIIPSDERTSIDPTGMALIAWDGSYEAANAVRMSVGLLKMAAGVQLVRVEEAKDEKFPSTRVLEYLSRQGVHAELVLEEAPASNSSPEAITACLLSRAH